MKGLLIMIIFYINIDINLINHNIINFKFIINLKIQLLNSITIYNNKLIQLTKLTNLYSI